jgi:predicted nuclease with TOPRIM domain
MRFSVIYAFLLAGCTSQFAAFRGNQDSPLNEAHMEIADLRHAIHSNEMEVKLLEERLELSERESPRTDEILELKRKITQLEKRWIKCIQTSAL